MKTCNDCRFKKENTCVRFNITINESYKACNDYAEAVVINESKQKIQLND